MPDVTLTYKGQTILELDESATRNIKLSGKYCEDDISLAYVKSGGGGGSGYNILKGSSPPSIGIGQDGDVYLQYFELPSEYQRVEYLEFEPSIGIIVTIPTIGYVCYAADIISTKLLSSEGPSIVFGLRQSSTSGKDFELGATYQAVYSWIRSGGTDTGLEMYNNNSYTPGSRTTVYITLKSPRSTALIGRYAYYDSWNVNSEAFKGKFYSLKGTNIETNQTVAWFVPCYRKSDNKVGVYDYIAQAFYCETYAVDSGHSITAGPDVSNTQDGIVSSFVKVNGAWQALDGSDVDDVADSGMYTGIEAPPPASLGTDGDYYYQRSSWRRSIQSVNASSIHGSNNPAYGTEFTVTEPVTVTHLSAWTTWSQTGIMKIGTTSEILAETETASFPANKWTEVPLQSSIQLSPGRNYVVKVFVNSTPGTVAYVQNLSDLTYDSKVSYVATHYGTLWPGSTESGTYALVGISYSTSEGVYKILKQFHKDSGSWAEIT